MDEAPSLRELFEASYVKAIELDRNTRTYTIRFHNQRQFVIPEAMYTAIAYHATGKVPAHQSPQADNWANQSTRACHTCQYYVPKTERNGHCRRHAPSMAGYPVVLPADWCGDHKLP